MTTIAVTVVVDLAIILVAAVYATNQHRSRDFWKKSWREQYDYAETVKNRLADEMAGRVEAEKKCGECFLDQAELRKRVVDLESEKDLTAASLRCAEAESHSLLVLLNGERRSNASLRGQITKMKGKISQ